MDRRGCGGYKNGQGLSSWRMCSEILSAGLDVQMGLIAPAKIDILRTSKYKIEVILWDYFFRD